MDKKKVNLIFSLAMMVLGILNICVGLLDAKIPHELRLVVAVFQIILGAVVLYTSILKLKGKF